MRRRYAAELAAIGIGVAACFLIARPRYLRWAATHEETQEPLPGDDLIVKPNLSATRAVTVRAAVEQVFNIDYSIVAAPPPPRPLVSELTH